MVVITFKDNCTRMTLTGHLPYTAFFGAILIDKKKRTLGFEHCLGNTYNLSNCFVDMSLLDFITCINYINKRSETNAGNN